MRQSNVAKRRIRVQPNSPQAYNNMGNASFAQGKLREAAGLLRTCPLIFAAIHTGSCQPGERTRGRAALRRGHSLSPSRVGLRAAKMPKSTAALPGLAFSMMPSTRPKPGVFELWNWIPAADGRDRPGAGRPGPGRLEEARSRLGQAMPPIRTNWERGATISAYSSTIPRLRRPSCWPSTPLGKGMDLTVPGVTPYRNAPDPHRALRVGYVSPDFAPTL